MLAASRTRWGIAIEALTEGVELTIRPAAALDKSVTLTL
jgi:hypothetical protein